jgi:MFS family permease
MIKPLETEFGWSPPAFMGASSFLSAGIALTTPIVGRIADRAGVRPVAFVSLLLVVLGMVATSLLTPSISMLYGICFIVGLLEGAYKTFG